MVVMTWEVGGELRSSWLLVIETRNVAKHPSMQKTAPVTDLPGRPRLLWGIYASDGPERSVLKVSLQKDC